jgi:hypothetical protein
MSFFTVARRSRQFRFNVAAALAALAFFCVYFVVLMHEERQAEQTYGELREKDPDTYLEKIRQVRGFQIYLREFRTLKRYDQSRVEAPPFLIGRWALFAEQKRVGDAYVPPSCMHNITIQDGHLRIDGRDYPVHYVMQDLAVVARRTDGPPFVIAPIGYGAHLHHIEVTVPDHKGVRYGYLCK